MSSFQNVTVRSRKHACYCNYNLRLRFWTSNFEFLKDKMVVCWLAKYLCISFCFYREISVSSTFVEAVVRRKPTRRWQTAWVSTNAHTHQHIHFFVTFKFVNGWFYEQSWNQASSRLYFRLVQIEHLRLCLSLTWVAFACISIGYVWNASAVWMLIRTHPIYTSSKAQYAAWARESARHITASRPQIKVVSSNNVDFIFDFNLISPGTWSIKRTFVVIVHLNLVLILKKC